MTFSSNTNYKHHKNRKPQKSHHTSSHTSSTVFETPVRVEQLGLPHRKLLCSHICRVNTIHPYLTAGAEVRQRALPVETKHPRNKVSSLKLRLGQSDTPAPVFEFYCCASNTLKVEFVKIRKQSLLACWWIFSLRHQQVH